MTATRIVTITPAILVIVGTFEIFDIKKTRVVTWTPTIPVTVDTFESLGLAAKGPYHGGVGGGAVDTGHDTIYRV